HPARRAGRLRVRHHRPARLRLRLPTALAHRGTHPRHDPRTVRPGPPGGPRSSGEPCLPPPPPPPPLPRPPPPLRPTPPPPVPGPHLPFCGTHLPAGRQHRPPRKEHVAMTTPLSVIGVGYLGAVHAAAMAELGHDVIGLDIDAERISALQAGIPPFHEPGFEQILRRGLDSGRLRFTTDYADLAHAEVH